MRIIFAGTPDIAADILQDLEDDGHDIVAVLTRTDAAVGRKRTLTPSPVAERAELLGIPVIKTDNVNDPKVIEEIRDCEPDMGAVVAYGGLIPPEVLAMPSEGWVNLHFSVLPAYRGAAPVQWSIINQEPMIGASVFRLEESLDTGPVFQTVMMLRDPNMTAGETLKQLAGSGGRILSETLWDHYEFQAHCSPQIGTPSYARKLTNADGHIDAVQQAEAVLARINGATPEPGAWALLNDEKAQRLKFAGAQSTRATPTGVPGSIVMENKSVLLICADGAVELSEIQQAGKKMMQATDWMRGAGQDIRLQTSATHPNSF